MSTPKRWFDSDATAARALGATTSPEAMVKLLSEENLRLLRLIATRKPNSLHELATLSHRKGSNPAHVAQAPRGGDYRFRGRAGPHPRTTSYGAPRDARSRSCGARERRLGGAAANSDVNRPQNEQTRSFATALPFALRELAPIRGGDKSCTRLGLRCVELRLEGCGANPCRAARRAPAAGQLHLTPNRPVSSARIASKAPSSRRLR